MEGGWIKLWRAFLHSPIWQNPNLCRFALYCLMKATHKETKVAVGYKRVVLQPGQFVFGRKQAAKETKLSERTIRTCLTSLEKEHGFLTSQMTNRYSVISICKWELYQHRENENDQPNDQQATSKRPANDQQATTYKNVKKNKNVKNKEKESMPAEAGASSVEVPFTEIVSTWNTKAEGTGLSLVQSISKTRKAHLRARWSEKLFREKWAVVFEKATASDFFRQSSVTWANFDWLIRNDNNYAKVLEGKYDNRNESTDNFGF